MADAGGERVRPAADPDGKLRVFISYSRDDLAFAGQLVAGLEPFGFDPILDRHGHIRRQGVAQPPRCPHSRIRHGGVRALAKDG
jgi:hypothetical protein